MNRGKFPEHVKTARIAHVSMGYCADVSLRCSGQREESGIVFNVPYVLPHSLPAYHNRHKSRPRFVGCRIH